MTALPDLTSGRYKACLFDMDGVLTDTASVHAAAWKRTFDEFLRDHDGNDFKPFTIEADYTTYVDGKPRNAGVHDFLASRNIELPEGTPTDDPGTDTVWAVGNRKNQLLLSVLEEDGVTVYEGSRKLLAYLQSQGVKLAVVSSSANTEAVLTTSDMLHFFQARVDGVSIIERGIKGKPAPDTFIEAARELGFTPREAVVFEDALAGVAAGRSGDFALVVGVDRVGQAKALLASGADVVVQDLAAFLPTALSQENGDHGTDS